MASLADLRSFSRNRAEKENDTNVSDAELDVYINSGISELHEQLVTTYGEPYFLKSTTFSTVAGQVSYPVPTVAGGAPFEVWKIYRLSVVFNNRDLPFRKFGGATEVLDLNSQAWDEGTDLRYAISGQNLTVQPVPSNVVTVTVSYVPYPQVLVNAGDVLDLRYDPWAEFIHIFAAIEMRDKEESDTSVLAAKLGALKARIARSAPERDIGQVQTMRDSYAGLMHRWIPRLPPP